MELDSPSFSPLSVQSRLKNSPGFIRWLSGRFSLMGKGKCAFSILHGNRNSSAPICLGRTGRLWSGGGGGLGGAAGEQPRGGRPTGSLSPSRARGPEPRGQAQHARSVAPFLICCWSLNTRSLLHPAASASPWLQPLCKGPQSSSWKRRSYEKTETERAQVHLALAFSRNFLENSYFIREAEEFLCPGSLPQTPAVGWGGARATSRAGTQSTLSHGGSSSHHLLPPKACKSRKVEVGTELGLEPGHSELECEHRKRCLNRCTKCLPRQTF